MNIKKLQAIFIMTALLFGVSSASEADYKTKLTLSIASAGPDYDETYTLTVPSDFIITKSGWNELNSLTAKYSGTKDGFNPSKKLVITATSTNNFTLVANGVNSGISYYLATGENDTSATTTFEFAASEITTEGTSKTIGVNVEDYSSKAAGDYEDEITYSVEVQNAPITVTLTNSEIITNGSNSFTKDGVTINSSYTGGDDTHFGEGAFTTDRGNFTKIEVTVEGQGSMEDATFEVFGGDWTISDNTATWTGNASNVSFGHINAGYYGKVTFVFTIEPQSEPEGGSDNANINFGD